MCVHLAIHVRLLDYIHMASSFVDHTIQQIRDRGHSYHNLVVLVVFLALFCQFLPPLSQGSSLPLLFSGVFRCQFAFVGLQVFDDVVDGTIHSCRDCAATVADTVISDSVLREVVGTNLFATVTSAN